MRCSKRFLWLRKKTVLTLILVIFIIVSLLIYSKKEINQSVIKKIVAKQLLSNIYERKIVPGLGEWGKPAAALNISTDDAKEIEYGWNKYGYNAWLGERISLERKLSDVRDKRCEKLFDNIEVGALPSVSIIIIYYNENPNTLLRTLHSIWQRTPQQLLIEIILVDDHSTDRELRAIEFDDYIKLQFGSKVQHLHLEDQMGVMRARVHGARMAKGEVLVFLDAHIEACEDWLPPLLAPIKDNPKICTTPIIDTLYHETFEYRPASPARGVFNWDLNYAQVPLLEAELNALPAPHNNPVMNGGLFAINAEWFWHLGAYDKELSIWGGEQFELSFKLWLCGGGILEVPCSRLGHLYRKPDFKFPYANEDFGLTVLRNFKRVIEVWLDEYRPYFYARREVFSIVDPGDLRKQKILRKRLQCKPFKYFLTHVAPDLLKHYPLVEPNDYAFGALQSVADPRLCLDALLNKTSRHPVLQKCSNDLRYPIAQQHWSLSSRRDLRQGHRCLEARTLDKQVWLWPCHQQGGNQFWFYDRQMKMLIHGSPKMSKTCLEADIAEGSNEGQRVHIKECQFGNPKQQWNFGYVNETALNGFYRDLNEKWTNGVV